MSMSKDRLQRSGSASVAEGPFANLELARVQFSSVTYPNPGPNAPERVRDVRSIPSSNAKLVHILAKMIKYIICGTLRIECDLPKQVLELM